MHGNHSNIAILMATYNGAPYIVDQIRSIMDQSWPHWKLYIRDDGSQDATLAKASRLAKEFPNKIFILPSGTTRLGADGNFSHLMKHAEADYFMFCDQDDVWLPQKIEKSLHCMRTLEAEHGVQSPLLVYTDLSVVDADLHELDSSVWSYGYHDPESSRVLNRLLIQNMVFGCSILINSPLKELASPIPDGVVQYDWWIALVSACFGSSAYVKEPTLLYRQHGRNTVGAHRWGIVHILGKFLRVFEREELMMSMVASTRQAGILLDRYRKILKPEHREMIAAYSALANCGFLEKRKTLLRYGFFKTGLIRNMGLFLRI